MCTEPRRIAPEAVDLRTRRLSFERRCCFCAQGRLFRTAATATGPPVGYPPTAVGYPPTAVGYPPTAVGYPPTAVGYPPTAVGYPPTAVCYPPTAVGYPPTAVGYPPTAVGYPPTAVTDASRFFVIAAERPGIGRRMERWRRPACACCGCRRARWGPDDGEGAIGDGRLGSGFGIGGHCIIQN